MHEALVKAATEPLVVKSEEGDVWYWAADDEDNAKTEIKRRVDLTSENLIEFLKLHNRLFMNYEEILEPNKLHGIKYVKTQELIKNLEAYGQLVAGHQETGQEYLAYPHNTVSVRSRLEYATRIAVLKQTSRLLAITDIEQEKFDRLYLSNRIISDGDITSYQGRIELVRNELTDKFGLKL